MCVPLIHNFSFIPASLAYMGFRFYKILLVTMSKAHISKGLCIALNVLNKYLVPYMHTFVDEFYIYCYELFYLYNAHIWTCSINPWSPNWSYKTHRPWETIPNLGYFIGWHWCQKKSRKYAYFFFRDMPAVGLAPWSMSDVKAESEKYKQNLESSLIWTINPHVPGQRAIDAGMGPNENSLWCYELLISRRWVS